MLVPGSRESPFAINYSTRKRKKTLDNKHFYAVLLIFPGCDRACVERSCLFSRESAEGQVKSVPNWSLEPDFMIAVIGHSMIDSNEFTPFYLHKLVR
jgi:hypothetical protein